MISIVLPVVRTKHIELLIPFIRKQAGIEVEIVWAIDINHIGAPKMVKQLVDKTTHDLVLFMGDDCLPHPNFAKAAYNTMQTFLGEWGLVGLNDLATQNPTHWLAHKRLLPEIGGEFFHTGYFHNFCDCELQLRAEKIGRYKWCESAKLEHIHPVMGKGKWDEHYARASAQDNYLHDCLLFNTRNKAYYDWNIPK